MSPHSSSDRGSVNSGGSSSSSGLGKGPPSPPKSGSVHPGALDEAQELGVVPGEVVEAAVCAPAGLETAAEDELADGLDTLAVDEQVVVDRGTAAVILRRHLIEYLAVVPCGGAAHSRDLTVSVGAS
jgi:hypothetical protein